MTSRNDLIALRDQPQVSPMTRYMRGRPHLDLLILGVIVLAVMQGGKGMGWW